MHEPPLARQGLGVLLEEERVISCDAVVVFVCKVNPGVHRPQASEDIPFYRSDWSFSSGSSARTPINYASAYLDLDFLYGRTEEEALSLRSMEDGLMNISGQGIPHRNPDGTWKVRTEMSATVEMRTASAKQVQRLERLSPAVCMQTWDDDVFMSKYWGLMERGWVGLQSPRTEPLVERRSEYCSQRCFDAYRGDYVSTWNFISVKSNFFRCFCENITPRRGTRRDHQRYHKKSRSCCIFQGMWYL